MAGGPSGPGIKPVSHHCLPVTFANHLFGSDYSKTEQGTTHFTRWLVYFHVFEKAVFFSECSQYSKIDCEPFPHFIFYLSCMQISIVYMEYFHITYVNAQ